MTEGTPKDRATAASSFDEVLGARLRAVREARGLPQAALAGQAAISRNRLAGLEAGTSPITVEALVRLARALGTDVATLLGGVQDIAVLRNHPLQPLLRDTFRDTPSALRTWDALRQALEEHLGPAPVAGSAPRRRARNGRPPASGAPLPPRSAPSP